MANYLDNDIKFVAGVGEARARLLEKELGIRTLGDMLCHYPFRYIDRTRIYRIDQIAEGDSALIQFRGRITGVSYAGAGRKRRFTAVVNDGSGVAELVWFQGIKWIEKRIEVGREYLIFGRPSFFKGELSVVHPEIETIEKAFSRKAESGLQGIYSSTERLSSVLGTKGIYTIVCNLWPMVRDHIRETLPDRMRIQYGLLSLRDALYNIHFPQSPELLRQAQYRLKFEELLGIQLGIQSRRTARLSKNNGFLFPKVGGVFNTFFNTRLPFPLTGAQKRVVKEIRQDTISGYQMNRLLQGDVGSGKTLVALMSMLLAVDNGFQACMMAPTEILARQHYATFRRMLEGMDVRVAILTGASKARERREALAGIADGSIDLLIGTHALIEDRVQFSNLGFVVIDEQHRFGVEQRARLWTKNEQPPHILVMTATPIPRTLNMAMSGIRDLSTIEQPPIERQPVETFVLEYNDVILAEAMKKELARGGQVYYLHNRVDNIESCAAHVSQMVPGARVGIAHGKMTEEELNPVWQHLLNGEIDILVCTTLIETGIDVRNCNTLIIEDADRMGLAQLYQIRGRVGRSGRKAYAYFTFRRDKTLTDIAQKRLSAIREFTAFGSGFRIAMRDLQIRGAGSLLGHSQHGHMEAVGYDLYVKMLGQAIARARGEPVQRDKSDCLVDLRVDAFIPEKYIPDGAGRIEAYKRIAAIQTPEDAADVLDELIDRYGDPPPSVSDLVNVSLVRVQAAAVGVYEVTQKKDTLILNLETLDLAMIRGLLQAFNGRVTAGAGTKPYLSVVLQPDEKPLELLQNILKAMADILTGTEREKAPQTGGAGTRKRD